MGELGAFLRLERVGFDKRDPNERVHDYRQYFALPDDRTLRDQGARCMDCGVPFCHEGCPLGNLIPDWNDLVYRDHWRDALAKLHATNNFPEFTGPDLPGAVRVGLRARHQRRRRDDRADRAGDRRRAGSRRAGSSPSRPSCAPTAPWPSSARAPPGLAVAAELNKLGPHRHGLRARRGARRPAALRRAGREAREVDHRPAREAARGRGRASSSCDVDVGGDVEAGELRGNHDAVVVAIGSRVHRDLEVPGRELAGVHFAMDYLYQRNRAVAAMEGRDTPPDAAGPRDQRRGQARGRGRRRRHRHGLHLERAARGRRGRAPARRLPAAPGRRAPARHALAAAAQAHRHHLRAGRGRRAPLRHAGDGAARRGRPRDRRERPARGGHLVARPARGARAASSRSAPSWC